ncbi:Uma2 family endonuclease [Synechococcus sp. Cruz-9H2]|uniref:Uma2 family endonuclease n=1 Tax=unclassified Synechococcus TaxID=2626047 RepID=UPI0020CDD9B4|nr:MULTISPECIES: Uma2 family endonuclease [unclassified Synechococcus]MCP9820390.1 Uma2 family endonuclease [Synechococcus sp. Cruz-9H2]MCP9844747.1 Uma2 family endonuclease [Synechococcus sp. Edmonson 11F2]MCP9856820.1 Uma2 family endonuclease [Synechococcus sp. Cruz-9C9]MCP9864155.1 Uma2 family endonuclease [Synechococcus sp. Cruz-7E5]MCP9871350.1 Uma2 family endonuclease [Synechococcus sp. Cruz-7B9]
MTLAPPSPTPGVQPLQLPWDLRLNADQFELVCQANPDAVLELMADGRLIAMTPTGSETGARNQALGALLWWAVRRSGLPLKVFDSSSGFRLPDGSVLSPDASLVRLDRWQALTPEQRRGFAPLCPDLVVELASASDQGPRGVRALRQKMDTYQANGTQLGWLLLPEERVVEIWRAGAASTPERHDDAKELDGGELFAGLVVDLAPIWDV